MALLPRLQANACPRVPVDLPRNIIRATCEGRARLGQPGDGEELPLDAAAAPTGLGVAVDGSRRWLREPDEALAVSIDE